jgi:hypothetical protein
MDLIQKGMLDHNLDVRRGWVEHDVRSKRRFVKAPTVKDMQTAFIRDKTRQVHYLDLPPETVLDLPRIDELKQAYDKEALCWDRRPWTQKEWITFYREWQLMITWLFTAAFSD